MPLADLRIDEIVTVEGLPSYTGGRATFTNGRTYDFDADFGRTYAAHRIFVRRPTDGRPMDPPTRTARAIHDRPGLADVAKCERVTARPKSAWDPASRDLRPGGGPSAPTPGPSQPSPPARRIP